ncbi:MULTISPECIES: DUF998 domain-containing protein [Brevibacterium]|nr:MULTISPECIES: DUF998 domain-containing protein [Brevibacterium]
MRIPTLPPETATASAVPAVCWVVAAGFWFLAEAVAASTFPGYSYATNYISDLAVPDVEVLAGREIDSPLHLLVTAAFIVQGMLFTVGAVGVFRAHRFPLRRSFLVLSFAHAVGMVTIALVHGGRQNVELGLDTFHMLGAFLAFIAGNLVAVVAGASLVCTGNRRLPGWGGIVLGTLGLLGLIMLQVDVRVLSMTLLPDGVWERMTFYAILVWQLIAGIVFLRRPSVQN